MFYNIEEKKAKKFYDKFEDRLTTIAETYSEFYKKTDDMLLFFNEHLKKFPVINSWRIELCYLYEQCRFSLISAHTAYSNYKEFGADDSSYEKIHESTIAEYYLENVTYRLFSILEKVGHLINDLMELGLKVKQVSFHKVKEIINKHHNDEEINDIITEFENSDLNSPKVKELRNAITHRNDPFQPHYVFNQVEFAVENTESDLYGKKLSALSPEQIDPQFEVETMLETVTKFYDNLTDFIDKILSFALTLLQNRYTEEVRYYGSFLDE